MKERDKQKLIGNIGKIPDEMAGEPLYFRPFQSDDRMIAELARATGKKKSEVAQKILHLALRGRQIELGGETKQNEKLDWLINNEKHERVKSDVRDQKLERLEDHARELERKLETVAENSRFARVILGEIYCAVAVCVSYLNQIFTKLIEYLSPVEIEKNNSADFANRNILGLIEHALAELGHLSEHHEFDLEAVEPEILYLFTKIERIKSRLLPAPAQKSAE